MADTPSVPFDPALYKVAYDEAVRGLTTQANLLDNLRTRAGLLLTAANVVTAFLAPQAITNGSGFGFGATIAIALFVATVGLGISVLLPRNEWKFAVDAEKVIAKIEGDDRPSIGDIHRWLATNGERAWCKNRDLLRSMFTQFQVGCITLGLEVVVWIAVLAKII